MSEPLEPAARAQARDERALVVRARGGDHDAYAALVRQHEEAAFRVAYVVVGGSAADAEDVVQDAFVKAYRALDRFRVGAPFRPWLLRIVGNEARNARRAAGRRAFHHQRRDTLAPDPGHATPEEELIESERRQRLFAALDELGEAERAAVVARYLIGLTDAEAAGALGVPRATVKMRAWRGLGRLRRRLEGELE